MRVTRSPSPQLRDVVAGSAFGVDPGGVVVDAEVVEPGGGVVEQVPDDDQDRAGDCDEGLEFAAAFDDAAVAFTEEGVGFGGRGRASPSAPLRYGLPLPPCRQRWIAPDWMVRGHSFAHETRCAAVGNRLMSSPISARMICAAPGPMPGISSSRSIVVDSRAPSDRWPRPVGVSGRRRLGFHRGEQLLDAGGQGGDLA